MNKKDRLVQLWEVKAALGELLVSAPAEGSVHKNVGLFDKNQTPGHGQKPAEYTLKESEIGRCIRYSGISCDRFKQFGDILNYQTSSEDRLNCEYPNITEIHQLLHIQYELNDFPQAKALIAQLIKEAVANPVIDAKNSQPE